MHYKTIRALPSSAAHHPPLTTIHRLTRYLDTPPHELPSTSWEGTLPPSTTACTGLPTPLTVGLPCLPDPAAVQPGRVDHQRQQPGVVAAGVDPAQRHRGLRHRHELVQLGGKALGVKPTRANRVGFAL